MARITVEDCLEQVPNRFTLILLAAERSKQILQGSQVLIEDDRTNKEIVTALREVAAGVVAPDMSLMYNDPASRLPCLSWNGSAIRPELQKYKQKRANWNALAASSSGKTQRRHRCSSPADFTKAKCCVNSNSSSTRSMRSWQTSNEKTKSLWNCRKGLKTRRMLLSVSPH